jgi:hypothetical protein
MSDTGPFYLRWRKPGSAKPELEPFDDLDAALDAVEARWETLQHQAPQILDARKILLISTDQLKAAMVEEDEAPDGT